VLYYKRCGSGPPLVLVHGFLGGVAEWDDLIAHFSPSFDVIAVDLPGFGGSAPIPAPATLAGYADLVVELLDALEIKRCTLLGHSLGSMIAQQFALDHRHRIERLVLYGAASTGNLPGRFETFDATIDRFKRIGIAEGGEAIIASWFVAGRSHPAYQTYRRMAEAARTDTAVATLRAIAQWQVTDRLGSIDAPTLVIGGDRDRSTEPAEQFRLWRGLPFGQLCILPNCAHAAHLEQPKIFHRILSRFLAEA
jgi:pimeloyl-ACP methyl ester carboxylesterase